MDLKYLDPAFPFMTNKIIIEKEDFNLKCYFDRNFSHNMHGNNSCINSLVDIITSLREKLEESQKRIDNINAYIGKNLTTRDKLLENLVINNDYIKNQNNEIIGLLNKLETFDKNNVITILNSEMDKINKQYNKLGLLLKELKHLSLT